MKQEAKQIEESDAQTVGELLRNTRLKQGKTLSDVSKDLCIRKVYLEAIEGLDYESLPPVPYGMGFVRSYAEYLGLNSQRIVLSYKKAATPDLVEDENEQSENKQGPDFSAPGLKHIIFGICGVAVLATAFPLISQYQNQEDVEEIAIAEADPSTLSPVIIEEVDEDVVDEMVAQGDENVAEQAQNVSENSAVSTSADTKEENKGKEVSLQAEKEVSAQPTPITGNNALATEETTVTEENTRPLEIEHKTRARIVLVGPSWIEVKQNGKILLNGTFGKEFTYDIPDGENTVVSVGRYYNVDFYIDGHLTKVASSMKQTNINLDKFLEKRD